MAIADTTTRGMFLTTVIRNESLCREHFRLVLRLPNFPETAPGQFIQIECRDPARDRSPEAEMEWSDQRPPHPVNPEFRAPLALLRRPFSLAGRRDMPGGVELDVIHRVVGIGTDWMSHLRAGNSVSVLGPLGNRFELPREGGFAILVGGGVGIPPMLYLAEALAGRGAIAFVGATARDLLPVTTRADGSVEEFARHGIPSIISTDDGSLGVKGFVTTPLEAWLDQTVANRKSQIASPIIYTCGPEPMMKRVAAIAQARRIECQVAVERAMACGMGTCQSCCIRVRKPDPSKPPMVGSNWCWRLACTDGPIFRGADLLW